MEITQQLLRELFDYREDGSLVRKHSTGGNGNHAGKVVAVEARNKYHGAFANHI